MVCKICNVRKPRRMCPGVGGEICAVCCGTSREETISCPLDCEYLREARGHEKPPEVDPKQIPNLDIEVTDSFLREHEPLLAFTMRAVAGAALTDGNAVDFDVREALDAMVRTLRTRASGLYYDTKPSNLIAAGVQARVEQNIEEFRRAATERYGLTTIRDAEVLGVLAFLERIEYQVNNGRKRGRAFIDFLRSQTPAAPDQPGESPVVTL
ncbi:MAG: hypothetical protein ACM336_08335 [Acidobacteriota bacterium]